MNFWKRSYQPILRYLYAETIKRGGEISLHKHFKQIANVKVCVVDIQGVSKKKHIKKLVMYFLEKFFDISN